MAKKEKVWKVRPPNLTNPPETQPEGESSVWTQPPPTLPPSPYPEGTVIVEKLVHTETKHVVEILHPTVASGLTTRVGDVLECDDQTMRLLVSADRAKLLKTFVVERLPQTRKLTKEEAAKLL